MGERERIEAIDCVRAGTHHEDTPGECQHECPRCGVAKTPGTVIADHLGWGPVFSKEMIEKCRALCVQEGEWTSGALRLAKLAPCSDRDGLLGQALLWGHPLHVHFIRVAEIDTALGGKFPGGRTVRYATHDPYGQVEEAEALYEDEQLGLVDIPGIPGKWVVYAHPYGK